MTGHDKPTLTIASDELHQANIMIIDDAWQMLDFIKKALEAEGFCNVREFNSPVAALEAVGVVSTETAPVTAQNTSVSQKSVFTPDVVIVDYAMPNMNGVQFLTHCKTAAYLADVPFIMLTANTNNTVLQDAFRAGIFDYIHKPVSLTELIVRLEHALKLRFQSLNLLKRTEELHASQRLYRALTENFPNGTIAVVDRNFRYLLFEGQDAVKFGVHVKNTIRGKSIRDIMSRHDAEQCEHLCNAALTKGESFAREIRLVSGYYLAQAVPMYDEKGDIYAAQLVLHNTTDRKRVEEMLRQTVHDQEDLLEQLQQAKQQSLHGILKAQEQEREHIARDLHDGVGHLLSVVKMSLSVVQEDATSAFPHHAERLESMLNLLDNAAKEVRNAAHRLIPVTLRRFGLIAALEEMKAFLPESRLAVDMQFHGFGDERLPGAVEIGLYRITQEFLQNTIKYAHANTVTIQITRFDTKVLYMFEDDGRGFDTQANAGGSGISNAHNRVLSLAGTIDIYSQRGHGMSATIEIPLTESEQVTSSIAHAATITNTEMMNSTMINNDERGR